MTMKVTEASLKPIFYKKEPDYGIRNYPGL